MKVSFIFKPIILTLAVLLFSCDSSLPLIESPFKRIETEQSLLLVPAQIPLPNSIKGVQFFRKNYPGSPPIIRLSTDDQLQLRFDELSSLSGQFVVTFTHYNQDWEESGLADIWTYEGINEQAILANIAFL